MSGVAPDFAAPLDRFEHRPIAFLDFETTGLDTQSDRILELAFIRLLPDGTREELVQEALANRAKAKKVFDELSPETRERTFSAVLGPDWKSQYEDDA